MALGPIAFACLCLFAWTSISSTSVLGQVLRNYQLAQPPVVPKDGKACTIKVLERDFALSYYLPEIVTLVPPTDCGEPGSWAAVTLNLTVTSNGTQYDRLAIFSVNYTEIWRTSTPEPTRGDGIIWTYLKDVSPYMPLFSGPSTFLFELNNIIQEGLDGVYSTVVHATYYESSRKAPPAPKSDLIIPLSTRDDDSASVISVPPEYSINVTVPQNTVEIYAEIFASGNYQEEFWFSNIANEYIDKITLGESIAWGQGPFREVRLSLDGQIVGSVFPYVTFFTGAAAPPLWRPICSYGCMDLPTYPVDLTPFVPLLTDGKEHTFTFSVVSSEPDHTTLDNWYLTGNLQLILDPKSEKPTTGKVISYLVEDEYPSTSVTGNVYDDGQRADVTVKASRRIHVESLVVSGSGKRNRVTWTQNLGYSNVQTFTGGGLTQIVDQNSWGMSKSTQNGRTVVKDGFKYPLIMNLTYLDTEALRNWTVTFDHGYHRDLAPSPLVLGTKISTEQSAWSFFQLRSGGNFGNGTSENTFAYVDTAGNTYRRKMNAALNVIEVDQESGSLAPYPLYLDSEYLDGSFPASSENHRQEVVALDEYASDGRRRGTTSETE